MLLTPEAKEKLHVIVKAGGKKQRCLSLEIIRGCCAEIYLFEACREKKGGRIIYNKGLKIYGDKDVYNETRFVKIGFRDGNFMIEDYKTEAEEDICAKY